MSMLYVRDLIRMAQREYEACGYACAKTWPPQSRPLERLLGSVLVSPTIDLSFLTIEDYKLNRIREGAARATVNRELDGLSKGLTLAIDARIINAEDKPKIRRFRLRNARQGFVWLEEFEAIHEHLPIVVGDIAIFAYWTGWRKGEILTLRWDRVQRLRALCRDKNGDQKTAVLCGPTLDAIERRRACRHPDCPFVFHRKGKPVKSFRKSWATAVRKSGLGRHVVFHDLRRSFINNGRQAGVNRLVLMKMSGHKTHAVHDRYNFVIEDEHREALLKMERRARGDAAS